MRNRFPKRSLKLMMAMVCLLFFVNGVGPDLAQATPLIPTEVHGDSVALFCDPFCGPPKHGGKSKDSGSSTVYSDIYGTVTNLTTGQPSTDLFVFVRINDVLLRTDTAGTFSLTGLQPGTYEVSLQLPGEYTTTQPPQTVVLGEAARANVELSYYSGPPPSEKDELVSPQASDDSKNAAVTSLTDSELCTEVYVVQADDWLSKIAERFLGDVLAYDQIVAATAVARAQDSVFAEIIDPDIIEPGFQLCIPATE